MRLTAASTDTGQIALGRLLGWSGVFATMLALLLLSSAASSQAMTNTPPATALLATTSASCFGYTARLLLFSMENNLATAAPNTVRDMRWRLEVSGPPDALTASLDAFTIRGDQANRDDLALLRWSASGSVGQWSAQGVVRLPSVNGSIQNSDKGRILAWLQTPHGAFGVRGITFDLHSRPDGLDAGSLTVLPTDGCPTLPAPTPTH